ncbi:synaptonemal complex central element protein 3 [Megalops cyprinoides]|uniref:synaptonemal complex central element protein 3 n=1 Tax=Megalops cyprinoides TaxID=118141 RepID=UPI001864D264|nr:synaptonemal complex central element protein 3 [Megalops cyprinoides]
MADCPASDMELHEENVKQLEEFSKDLEKMVEVMENVSVQLTWMAYDMVVLRTAPEVGESLRRLEEEFLQCKAVLESTCVEARSRSSRSN